MEISNSMDIKFGMHQKKTTLLTRALNKKYLRLVFHIENVVRKDICDNT